MIELRPYQKEAKTAFLDYCREGRGNRGVVVFPTGCGKTIFGLSLAKDIGGRTLWLAHREELITQPMKALKAVWPGVNAGVVKAERNEWARDFVFASVQTAWRPERREKLKGFDLVVIDECHRAPAKSYKLVLEAQGCMAPDGPPLLGLTATPERTDNIRLDDVFQDIVYQFQLRQAVEDGYLVDVEMIQEGINVNLDNVGSSRGDFNEGELDLALLEANIVGEVCKTVSKHARRKKTIIFTVSVKQAVLISEELCKQGYAATYVSGETPTDQRRERLAGFATGKYTHCVNCLVMVEGYDEPSIECVVMARPTQSKTLYIQCVGRGLRIAPGKDRCLIIDMVGVSGRHTLIQAPAIFGLEGQVDDTQTRTSPEEDGVTRHAQSLLLTQVQGTAPMARSRLRWVRAKGDVYALNCGEGGSVLMRPVGKEWLVEVIGRKDSAGREPLTMQPVDLELAQGIAEDYVRRASAVYLSSKSARWRDVPASPKQLEALRKWKIDFSDGITKGEASDLMTAAAAGSWRNEPATARQMRALRYRGVSFDEMTLTKGEAGRLLSK